MVSISITNVLSRRPFQTSSLLKQADHRQEKAYMFHYLIEQIRKFKCPTGTERMISVILPHAFPRKILMLTCS